MALRHHNGPLHFVPYGALGSVRNTSRDWVIDKFNLPLPIDVDSETIRKMIKKIGEDMKADPDIGPLMIEPLKGKLYRIDPGVKIFRCKFRSPPGKQFDVRAQRAQAHRGGAEEDAASSSPTAGRSPSCSRRPHRTESLMKALKYAVYAVGGVVALAVVAVVAAVVVVNGEFVKGKMEAAMQERHRTLKIEGTPTVSLFPVLRLGLGKTSLSEPNSEKNFATLESLEVAVRVMPLLSREVAVEALALKGLRLNVARARDGSFNFDDLAGPKQPEAAPAVAPKVRIAEVRIERAYIAYADQASGRTLAIGDINILTGRLEDDTPTPLSVSASISGKSPEVALKTQLSASARMNLLQQSFALAKLDARITGNADTLRGLDLRVSGDVAADAQRQEYAINALAVQMKGTLERDVLTGALDAPSLRITSSKAEGKAVTGTLSVRGPQRTVDAKLHMAAVEGSASTLTVPALVVDFSGEAGGNALKGEVTTPIKANLKEGVWELAKVAASLTLGRTDTALKAQLTGAATINPARQMVAVTGLDAVATGSYDTLKGLDLKFSGNVGADGIKNEYTADKVTLLAKGTLDRDAFTASFQAPKLRVTPSKAEGQAVTGAVSVKGPQRDVEAKLDIAAVEGSANSLSIPNLKLELLSIIEGNGVKGNISTPVRANLGAKTWEFPRLVANLTFSGPAIPQKSVTLPIEASVRADLAKQTADGELKTKFDETNVSAKAAASRFDPLVATFDLSVDKLDLDRYLPPDKKESKPDEPVDLSVLRGKTVTGKFAAGALTVKRAKLQNVKADVRLANGSSNYRRTRPTCTAERSRAA